MREPALLDVAEKCEAPDPRAPLGRLATTDLLARIEEYEQSAKPRSRPTITEGAGSSVVLLGGVSETASENVGGNSPAATSRPRGLSERRLDGVSAKGCGSLKRLDRVPRTAVGHGSAGFSLSLERFRCALRRERNGSHSGERGRQAGEHHGVGVELRPAQCRECEAAQGRTRASSGRTRAPRRRVPGRSCATVSTHAGRMAAGRRP
jgi:hypothetical protein